MTLNLQKPDITELKPRITVFGVGGGGGNAVNNMIVSGLDGVEFVVANTDAQALSTSRSDRVIQLGVQVTEGLGAGSQPEVGAAAAQECIDEIADHLTGTHMAFVTAGMGGGTGTGAAPVVARAAREAGILTVGVVTKPFSFEGKRRMALAEQGIEELQKCVDTLIVIPNQNLFRIANDKTTFAEAFSMADQVLYSGVACITDLMVKEGLINLDFADVRSVMREMGRAMMGTGEASGEGRAMAAAEAAISNPLLDETSMSGAQGLLISITGGKDMTLFEVDEAATRIREEVDADANIILGATFDESLEGVIRVSVVATGIDAEAVAASDAAPLRNELAADRARQLAAARVQPKDEQTTIAASIAAPVAKPVEPASAAAGFAQQSLQSAASLEKELAIAPAPAAAAEPVAEEKDAAEAISDAEFQSALEVEINAPAAPQPAAAQQMPALDDFPQVARESAQPKPAEDNGAMGLLKRLATNLGGSSEPATPRRETAPERTAAPQPTQAAPVAPQPQPATTRDGTLDLHGRNIPKPRTVSEEDQLDIPAFLRRQAN